MPVDLTTIPDAARRKHPPSIRRWLVALLIFCLCGGFLTSWLWPAERGTGGALFWHCFISAPLVLWLVVFSIRWLSYLAFEWPAEGWDDERERDIAHETSRGQRYLLLDSHCVHLPHIVASGVMTQQFLLPQGGGLPAVVDENTYEVQHHASFNDTGLALSQRVSKWLRILLDDATIQASLSRCSTSVPLKVIIQTACEDELNESDRAEIQHAISPLLSVSSVLQFARQFGLTQIDAWLDAPDSVGTLLLLSVNIQAQVADGESEAAVALFLRSSSGNELNERAVARIHRPEPSRNASVIYNAAIQALQWGRVDVEDIASLWLTGMGNKAQILLASHNLKFPRAESNSQLIDIDLKSGHTGVVSLWLAIALAAGNTSQSANPQLIMSVPEEDDLPWWLVVHPAAG